MNEIALAVEVTLASFIVVEHVGGSMLARRRLRRTARAPRSFDRRA